MEDLADDLLFAKFRMDQENRHAVFREEDQRRIFSRRVAQNALAAHRSQQRSNLSRARSNESGGPVLVLPKQLADVDPLSAPVVSAPANKVALLSEQAVAAAPSDSVAQRDPVIWIGAPALLGLTPIKVVVTDAQSPLLHLFFAHYTLYFTRAADVPAGSKSSSVLRLFSVSMCTGDRRPDDERWHLLATEPLQMQVLQLSFAAPCYPLVSDAARFTTHTPHFISDSGLQVIVPQQIHEVVLPARAHRRMHALHRSRGAHDVGAQNVLRNMLVFRPRSAAPVVWHPRRFVVSGPRTQKTTVLDLGPLCANNSKQQPRRELRRGPDRRSLVVAQTGACTRRAWIRSSWACASASRGSSSRR
jgi:hypothetical protein